MEYKNMNEWKENSEFNTSLIHDSMITSSIKKAKRDHRIKVIQTFSVLIFVPILAFTLLVNTSQQFVSAINDMPIISDFIDIFKYNPSIYKARNTDGFQKIDKTYITDDYTLYLESMVVDEDQIAIFYEVKTSLDESKYSPYFQIDDDFINSYTAGDWTFNQLCAHVFDPQYEIDFNKLNLNFHIESNPGGVPFGEPLQLEIPIDKDKIVEGKITELNQEMMIEDQKIMIEKIEVFPLRSIIYIEQDSNNTKEIRAFNLYMKSENGELIEGIKNGISSFGTGDYINAYVLESPYTIGGNIEVYLENVRWIDKIDKEIIYNKETNTCENLPPYIEFLGLEFDSLSFKVTGKYPVKYADFGRYVLSQTDIQTDGTISYEVFYKINELEFDENNETILIDNLGTMHDVNEYITTIELE